MTTSRAALAVVFAAFMAIALSACTETSPEIRIDVNHSQAAAQLREMLPVTLRFADRMGTAEVASLPEPLDIDEADMVGAYRAGDVVYWAAEQSLFVFLSDDSALPEDGLVLVGQVTDGMADIADCTQNCPIHVAVGR